jgi:hypothetical protein
MMVRLLGASALALALTTPAAQAAYRHHHAGFSGYRHYSMARFPAVRHHVAYRHVGYRGTWIGARVSRREDYDSRGQTSGRWDRERSEGFAEHRTFTPNRVSGGRPRAWCGWYARSLVGHDPGPEYNLARNWAHWGHAARPGVGVMVVWAHHVGMITGRGPDGQWIVKSGNDGGGAVRERPRSIAGAIAFRGS